MTKVKHSVATKRRKKRVLKKAKGFWGDRSKQFQQARRALAHAEVFAYEGRKQRKRDFRRLWITRINSACREEGITYSRFMNALKKANVVIDRKILADLAVNDAGVLKKLITLAKQ